MIIKRDRLAAESVRIAAADVFPAAEITLCHTASAALDTLRRKPASLAIIGLTLADMDGIDLAGVLLTESLARRLFVISSRRDERACDFLRETRLAGYLDPVSESPNALQDALRRVAHDGSYFSAIPQEGINPFGTPTLRKLLSRTEMEVFAVLAEGLDDARAADRLHVSTHTVRTHRQNLMRKLEVQTSRELIFQGIRRGVIRISSDRILHPGIEQTLAQRRARPLRTRDSSTSE